MATCRGCGRSLDQDATSCMDCGVVCDPAGLLAGQALGQRFLVEGPIAEGGQGQVLRATEIGSGRRAALKVAWPGASEGGPPTRALAREARALSLVDHPGVPALLGAGVEADGTRWLAMAEVEGRELSQLLAEAGPFPERWVVAVGARLLSALAAVHAAGLVHGDVTPANVLVDGHPGEPDGVSLIDFGLAGPAGEAAGAGEPLRLPGTPAYLGPERVRGAPADGRSDLYAVGVLLFELATGVPPFRAATAAGLLARHLAEPPPRLRGRRPELSAGLEAVVARALEKEPARRFADAQAMRQALLRCLPRG